ncbi:MAG: hypothetical protein GVY36_11375 [Verrucomicrobia bacterium]|jgi:hypothetical protein|nr:hypothetical protein [Verrucomicrobiota bacterium]
MPRDRDFENSCILRLKQLGLEIIPAQNYGELLALDAGGYQLSKKAPTTWAELLDQVFPQLEASGWSIRQSSGLKLRAPGQSEFYSRVQSRKSWFEYSVCLRYKGIRFSAVDLIVEFIQFNSGSTLSEIGDKLLRSNLALPLDGGEYLVLPDKLLQNVVHQVFELLGQRKPGDPLKLSHWRVAELAENGVLEAAEAQATDRSHRIGQVKPVFVYKLIAENTVEAKILELQKQKGKLTAGLLDQAPETAFSQWTEEAILGLFD